MLRRCRNLLPALAACAACASPQPLPLAHEDVVPIVRYAPPGEELPAAESSPQTLHIRVLALRDAPEGPAVDRVAARITRRDGQPFHGASTLPTGARWLTDAALAASAAVTTPDDARMVRTLGANSAVLAAGLTTTITCPGTSLPTLQVQAARGARVLPATVRLDPVAGADRGERVHLPAGLPVSGVAMLFVPTPGRHEMAGLGVVLAVDPGSPVAPDALAAARAAAAAVPAPPPEPLPLAWRTAFAAVGATVRRPALLALAAPLQQPRCVDLLAIADETALVDMTTALRDVDPAAADLAWAFERALWRALLPRLERDELSPALAAACWRHLGAAADDPGLLRLSLDAAADATAFAAALRDENLAALAARSAATRVRAHDWLTAQGAAVADYDPLAPLAARRHALHRHQAARPTPETDR